MVSLVKDVLPGSKDLAGDNPLVTIRFMADGEGVVRGTVELSDVAPEFEGQAVPPLVKVPAFVEH